MTSVDNAAAARTSNRRTNFWLKILAGLWLLLVGLGLVLLMLYSNRPGERGDVPKTWPAESGLENSKTRSTLLVFAHPQCPCTRATIDELSWIMSRCGESLDCRVLFFQPAGESAEWSHTDLWHQAALIEGVRVFADPQSRAAMEFGALTSGHVVMYDTEGNLRFEGGITPSRGHRGGNRGRDQVVSLLNGAASQSVVAGESESDAMERDAVESTCVFGCPLFAPEMDSTVTDADDRGES